MESRGIIGIDIGGTNFRIGLSVGNGSLCSFRKIPVKQVLFSKDPITDLSVYLKKYIHEEVRERGGIAPRAVSIGFPATLNKDRSKILQAPNLPHMEGLPVVSGLSGSLGLPVVIERDVTMALCCDCKRLNIPEKGITCGIYFGTGIGNAIRIDGKYLTGRNGTAGELGHIPVDGSAERCGCGNFGCMEALAGGRYLAQLAGSVYQGTEIGALFSAHGEEDRLVRFVDRMAMAAAAEVNILDPDYVLVGGGVLQMPDFPKERFLQQLHVHTRKPYPADNLRVVFTGDAEDKGVRGAVYYAGDRLRQG